jgi:VanZ family protein
MEFAEQRTRIKKRNRPLRLTLLGGSVVLLLAIVQFFAPARLDLWWQVFFEAMHAPVFGIIAVCLVAMTPPTWQWQGRVVVPLAGTLVLALLSELAQIPLPSRSASMGDLFNDLLGAVAFVSAAVVLSPSFHVPPGRGRWLILLAVLLLIWPFKPLASVSSAYWERYEQLPSIAPLGSEESRIFYNLNNAQVQFVRAGEPGRIAHRITFGAAGSSSINFHDPWSDWRAYQVLVLDVDNPGDEPLPLTIRVHDEAHLRGDQPHEDRFNRLLELAPGRNSIRIDLADVEQAPTGRDMDMGHIDGVVLFGTAKEAGRRFIIHDLRLEQGEDT